METVIVHVDTVTYRNDAIDKDRTLKWLAVVPAVLLIVSIVVLAVQDTNVGFEHPLLLFILNTLFLTVTAVVVAVVAAYAYVTGGTFVLLFLGCGVLAFGSGSLVAGSLRGLPDGANVSVTVYNVAAMVAATFHALSVTATWKNSRSWSPRYRAFILLGTYLGVLSVAAAVAAAAVYGLLPVFFAQDVGPTPLRQLVLLSAILLFALSAFAFLRRYVRTSSAFFYWYGVALGLIAVGLTAVFMSNTVGSPLSWIGRFAQYLGGLYFVVAVTTAFSRARSTRRSLIHAITTIFHEAEINYRALVETATDAMVSFDHTGGILLWNTAAEQMFGYDRHEVLGASFVDLIVPPSERPRVWVQIKALAEDTNHSLTGATTTISLDAHSRTETIIPTELSLAVRKTASRWIGTAIIRDVTERRRMEERLRWSEARLRAFFDNTLDAILVADDAGTYVDANPAACRLLGYERSELLGLTVWEITCGLEQSDFQKSWRSFLSTGKQSGEYQVRHKDGHAIDAEYRAVANVVPGLHLSTLRDVTARKRAVEALHESRQELEVLNATLEQRVAERTAALQRANRLLTQRNQELQEFAYVASHDLQEPLRKIRAFGDLLRSRSGDRLEKESHLYLERMTQAAARMSTLLEDLLTFSRVATHGQPFEPVDLDEVLHNVLTDLDLLMEEAGARVEVEPLPTIDADAAQMRRLMQQLIENAIKFRDPERTPIVEVRADVHSADGTHTVHEDVDEVCRLVVEDNGIGFEEKQRERIFDPFQRLHGRSAYGGTGMGLAIGRRIVERHGGTITAESTPGAGSRFLVTLPMRQPEQTS